MRLFAANLHGTLCCRSVLFPVESSTRNYRGKGLIYTSFLFLNFQLFCWVFWIYHNWSFCHLSASFCYLFWTVLPPTGERNFSISYKNTNDTGKVYHSTLYFFDFKYSLGDLFAAYIDLSAELSFKIKLNLNKHIR